MDAGMDTLPQELVTHIASFLEREEPDLDYYANQKAVYKLSPYAMLSRKWQLAIESRTFRCLRLQSTELPSFNHCFTQQPHRRHLLSVLRYEVVLPNYTDNGCAKFETKEDMQRNDQAFTHAIHALLRFLRIWQDDGAQSESQASHSLFLDI